MKKQREAVQIKTNNVWIDKIKTIKTIKGYEVKNEKLWYDVEAWDKNGQMIYAPPISS